MYKDACKLLPPNLSKSDLHLLYVFTSVAEAQGFSAAQIELNVSQSTISRQVSDLELRLGMKLCHRGRSGFRMTEKGDNSVEVQPTDDTSSLSVRLVRAHVLVVGRVQGHH